jgi:hypothetical protein
VATTTKEDVVATQGVQPLSPILFNPRRGGWALAQRRAATWRVPGQGPVKRAH